MATTFHEQKSGAAKRFSPQSTDFRGMNATDARQRLEEGEFAWLENAMTVGRGLVQILPAAGPTVATLAAGVASMTGVVLSGSPVLVVVGSDGSLSQVTPGGTVTAIAGASTVTTAARVTIWRDSPVLFVDPTKGYMKWNGSAFTVIDATKLGTSLAVYAGRAWLANNRTRQYTAPGTYDDFTPGNGSGSSVMTDEAFPGPIIRILSALDQLWQFGLGGINAISNVQVPTGQTQPTYSDTNIVGTIGTNNPQSILSFFRAMAFLSDAGVYSLVGVTPSKISDKLDGLFPKLTLTPDTPAAIAYLNELPVLCFLVTYQDPDQGARPLLLCYSGGKWFTAAQGGLTWITSLLVGAQWQCWGSDGTRIFRCFGASADTPTPYTIRSKFFDFGSMVTTKEVFHVAIEFEAPAGASPTLTLESNLGGRNVPITFSNVVTWRNTAGNTVGWVNDSGQTVTWIGSGLIQAVAPASTFGRYIGWTLTGNDVPWQLSGVALDVEPREEWSA